METPNYLVGSIAASLGILSTAGFFAMNTTINYLVMPTLLLGHPIRPNAKTDRTTFFSSLLGEPARSTHLNASSHAITPSTPTPVSRVSHLNRQWQEVYWRGHRYGPASAVFSTLCFSLAARYSSPLTARGGQVLARIAGADIGIKTALYVAAAMCAIFAAPYTVIVMVPGANDELHARGNAVALAATEDKEDRTAENETRDKDTLQLIKKWTSYSKVRAASAGVALFFGVIASHL
ncbi:hypothetical protein F5Y16DRAFT_392572 [Xylariaceae sp. FL0255]|nr:hypothetical protein F5Y16DRAFT_392572 [Xylariaceae sp. FL0255]